MNPTKRTLTPNGLGLTPVLWSGHLTSETPFTRHKASRQLFNVKEKPAIQIGVAGITALSIIGTFTYNRVFDPTLQSAQADALFEIGMLGQHCQPMTPELNRIRDFCLAACVHQTSADQLRALGELARGIRFGPTAALVDSAVTLGAEEDPNYCAQAYAKVVRLCPASLFYIPKASSNALLDAAR